MLFASLAAQAPEFDLGRVVFIIMLLVGGFLQWAMNWWKRKRAETAAMRQLRPTPEELEARERAWQRQTGEGDQVPPPLPARNPLEELLDTFREFAGTETLAPEADMPAAAAPPAAIPQPPKRQVTRVVEPPSPGVPAVIAVPAAPDEIVRMRERHPLALTLAAIGGLRQAVVLREILGPPKALQSADDHLT